jgi:hypothetical protein
VTTLQDLFEHLSTDYAECWDDDELIHPTAYDEQLEALSPEELLEVYNERFNTEITMDELE